MATLDELLFGAKLEAWRHKMFHIFHVLQCVMVLGIVNPLWWIFNAISDEKSCLISMPFLSTYIDVRTVIFTPCWILIGQFKFPARPPYARIPPAKHNFQHNTLVLWVTPESIIFLEHYPTDPIHLTAYRLCINTPTCTVVFTFKSILNFRVRTFWPQNYSFDSFPFRLNTWSFVKEIKGKITRQNVSKTSLSSFRKKSNANSPW